MDNLIVLSAFVDRILECLKLLIILLVFYMSVKHGQLL
jgi:hypothetical protein